jgi:hypothetical protein
LWWWFIVVDLDRTTLGFISHKLSLGRLQNGIYLAHFQTKSHGKVSFQIYVLLKFFFQHHIHNHILNIFSTNLHHVSLPFNFIIWIESNSIQVACNVIFYFHLNGIGFLQNQFNFFINWSSLAMCINTKPKMNNEFKKVVYEYIMKFHLQVPRFWA